ncbi:hypothetical protein CS022_06845 [Veronia nyctiphanis]|uniref:Uncharacterized protein n=1 Tax=Veronia nyctiphanis TaxID=1278244 RepID=A0A4Q0YUW8_9GAMM|nr:hypothetical protein [Veronia nyctiphanis]RXJ73984.1 hypothetical protein CS022_06845 [Veronia nyctiphanis]
MQNWRAGCTKEAVIDALNKQGVHPNQTRPFIPGQPYQADVDIPGPWGKDTISTTAIYDENGNQVGIKNDTLPDHILHPGHIERKVMRIGDSFHIVSVGKGEGPLAGMNVLLEDFIWGPVNDAVINQFK